MNFLLHHLLVQVLILHYVKILESSDRVPVEQHPAIRLRRRSCDVLFPIPEAKQVSAMGQDLLESRACYGPMDYIKINYSCCRRFLKMYFFSRLYPLSGKIHSYHYCLSVHLPLRVLRADPGRKTMAAQDHERQSGFRQQ